MAVLFDELRMHSIDVGIEDAAGLGKSPAVQIFGGAISGTVSSAASLPVQKRVAGRGATQSGADLGVDIRHEAIFGGLDGIARHHLTGMAGDDDFLIGWQHQNFDAAIGI